MCGIVGLLVKKPELYSRLGEWLVPMLVGMTERGPDSAGLAVFVPDPDPETTRLSLYAGSSATGAAFDWPVFGQSVCSGLDRRAQVDFRHNHATVSFLVPPEEARTWISERYPALRILASGKNMVLYKDVGLPAEIAGKYRFADFSGSHMVGHTRMATESAVTPDRAHPFTAGGDFCLVHNGSLSNPHGIRRMLEPHGIHFDTDNDTEAACRFLEWRLREGDTLEMAVKRSFQELDGFFTFLMGTAHQLALVRDPFACKPAIVAETGDYVAVASEFRSLAHLPGIADADLFEPAPEEVYIWTA